MRYMLCYFNCNEYLVSDIWDVSLYNLQFREIKVDEYFFKALSCGISFNWFMTCYMPSVKAINWNTCHPIRTRSFIPIRHRENILIFFFYSDSLVCVKGHYIASFCNNTARAIRYTYNRIMCADIGGLF